MTPNDYLLYSLQRKCYREKSWYYTAFSVTRETDQSLQNTYPGRLIREPFGIFYLDDELKKQPLEVKLQPSQPLFRINDRVIITKDWAVSLKEPQLETSIGTLLINHVCLIEAFGSRFPYAAGRLSPKKLEEQIAPKLKSTPLPGAPRDSDSYYVDELLIFSQGVTFLEQFTKLFSHSITKIGLMPAPGRREFKQELLKKYPLETLRDPVQMAKYEAELEAFDKEYLKQDPAYGKFMAGKVSKARMKSYMTYGGEEDSFSGRTGVTPIIPALEDGIPMDPEGFTAISNTVRYGSFSRGAETVNGGVTAKLVQRAGDTWRITDGDCGATEGIARSYSEESIWKLEGRYIILQNKPVLLSNKAETHPYINRSVFVRSPQYCRRPGTQTCQVCAGVALSKYPTGLTIPLTEISGGVLNDSLKKMHNSALVTAEMNLDEVIT